MTKQEDAQKEWSNYIQSSSFDRTMFDLLSDFKLALKAEFEREIKSLRGNDPFTGIGGLHKAIELIDETKPLK